MMHIVRRSAGVILIVLGVATIALSGSHEEAAQPTQIEATYN